MSKTSRSFRTGLVTVIASAAAAIAAPAHAQPEGYTPVMGAAPAIVYDPATNTWFITQLDPIAIANYTSFNIPQGAIVQFLQPGAAASFLNKINSATPTTIDGTVNADGNIFFVNPAGVIFGGDSVFNVGGLFAAAGNISDSDFANGVYRFTDLTGDVVNRGQINALTQVHLIGRHVANYGAITTGPNGFITMSASDGTVTISEMGPSLGYSVLITSTGAPKSIDDAAGVVVAGSLKAGKGIRLGAADVYSMAIQLGDRSQGGVAGGGGTLISGDILDFGAPVFLDDHTTIETNQVTFESTLDSDPGEIFGLDIVELDPNGGNATFKGNVGATDPLAYLTVEGTTTFDFTGGSGSVTTTGHQTYTGEVTLGADLTLIGQSLSLGDGLDGVGNDLTLTFGDQISVSNADYSNIRNFVSDGTGGTLLGSFTTSGTQQYANVTLGEDATLMSTGVGADGDITISGMLDSDATARALIVDTDGLLTFGDEVGGFDPLASFTRLGGGQTNIDGGLVHTTGAQDYGTGQVNLNAATELRGGSLVTANLELDAGANDLTLDFDTLVEVSNDIFLAVNNFESIGSGGTLLGSFTTGGTQLYSNAVSLNEPTTIVASTGVGADGDITFTGVISGGGNNLTVNSDGTTRFAQVDLGAGSLITDADGSSIFNGDVTAANVTINDALTVNNNATVTTAGGTQSYQGGVTLGAGTTTLVGQTLDLGGGGFTGGGNHLTLTFGDTLAVSNANYSGIGNFVSNGAVDLGSFTTSGTQTYNAGVALADALTTVVSTGVDAAGDITFNGLLTGGGNDLTVNSGGTTRFGQVNLAGGALVTDAAGSTVFDNAVIADSVNIQDALTINGGSVTTSGAQQYAAVTLGGASGSTTTIESSGAGNIAFGGLVSGAGNRNLTVNTDGATTFAQVSLTGGTLLTDAGGSTVFGGTVNAGAVNIQDSLTINGGSVTTTSTQQYADVFLGGAAGSTIALTSTGAGAAGNISIGGKVNSDGAARGLTVNTGGLLTFGDQVGETDELLALTRLGGGQTNINGGLVRTTGAQNYGAGLVTLGGNTELLGGSLVATGLTMNAASNDLTLGFGAQVDVSNGIFQNVKNFTSEGEVRLTGNFTTVGFQDYQDAVLLGANATLLAGAGSPITFGGAVDSDPATRSLTVNTTGLLTFGSQVGGSGPLNNFTRLGGGQTQIDGGLVRTVGVQNYGAGLVTLGGTTELRGGTLVTSNLDLDADGQDLTLAFGTQTAVNDSIFQNVHHFTSEGQVLLTGDFETDGFQDYQSAVTLGADVKLTAGFGEAITFGSMLNSDATARQLEVDTNGLLTFGNSVGNTNALASFKRSGGGQTQINGPLVRTTGEQDYGLGTVTLGGNTTLRAGSLVTTGLDLDAAGNDLALNIDANVAVNNGIFQNVKNFESVGTGETLLGNFETSGTQFYGNTVSLAEANTLVESTGAGAAGNITFNGQLNGGGNNLEVSTGGTTRFTQVDLTGGALVVDALGATIFDGSVDAASVDIQNPLTINGGSVTTTGTQHYLSVALGGAANSTTTLTSTGAGALGDIAFAGLVSGAAGRNLNVNTEGTTSFSQVNIAGGALVTDGDGVTLFNDTVNAGSVDIRESLTINGGLVQTTGTQEYRDVTLGNATTLNSGSAKITLGDVTVTAGGQNLIIQNSGGVDIASADLEAGALNLAGVTGGVVDVDGMLTAGQLLTGAAGYEIRLRGGAHIADFVNFQNTNGVTLGGGATYDFDGGVTSSASTTTLDGFVNTLNQNATFGALAIEGNSVIDSGPAGGNIQVGAINGPHELDLGAGDGNVILGGAIGAGEALARLGVSGATIFINGGTVDTTGDQVYAGDVRLDVADATLTTTVDGNIEFAGKIDGNRKLEINSAGEVTFRDFIGSTTPLADLLVTAGTDSLILFDTKNVLGQTPGNPFVTVNGTLSLKHDGLVYQLIFPSPVVPATIAANGHLYINVGVFEMGHFERMTVLGDLHINASTAAFVADLTAKYDLLVDAPDITILLRGPTLVDLGGGNLKLYDFGVDFVAERVEFVGNLHLDTTHANVVPRFASPTLDVTLSDNVGPIHLYLGDLPSDLTDASANTLDASGLGPSTDDLSGTLTGATDEPETEDITDDARLSAAHRELLRQIGINVRDQTLAELQHLPLVGYLAHDDHGYGKTVVGLASHETSVAMARLDGRRARQVVHFIEAYLPGGEEGDRIVADVRASLGSSWRDFGDQQVPAQFAMALLPDDPALVYLRDFAEFWMNLMEMGLTAREALPTVTDVLEMFRPGDMSAEQLREAIAALRTQMTRN